jgi:hypothetical protein
MIMDHDIAMDDCAALKLRESASSEQEIMPMVAAARFSSICTRRARPSGH